MPCGGISPMKPDFTDGGRCFTCNETGSDLWVEEWDTGIHYKCLGTFLASDEGQCVLSHGHAIYAPGPEEKSGVESVLLEHYAPLVDNMLSALFVAEQVAYDGELANKKDRAWLKSFRMAVQYVRGDLDQCKLNDCKQPARYYEPFHEFVACIKCKEDAKELDWKEFSELDTFLEKLKGEKRAG